MVIVCVCITFSEIQKIHKEKTIISFNFCEKLFSFQGKVKIKRIINTGTEMNIKKTTVTVLSIFINKKQTKLYLFTCYF